MDNRVSRDVEKTGSDEIRAKLYRWGALETFQQCKFKVNSGRVFTNDKKPEKTPDKTWK
jgi:hypothetical protein